jgi:hypothetical protein
VRVASAVGAIPSRPGVVVTGRDGTSAAARAVARELGRTRGAGGAAGPLSFSAVSGPGSEASSAGKVSGTTAAVAASWPSLRPTAMTPKPKRFAATRTMPANMPSPSGLGRRWRALTSPPQQRRPPNQLGLADEGLALGAVIQSRPQESAVRVHPGVAAAELDHGALELLGLLPPQPLWRHIRGPAYPVTDLERGPHLPNRRVASRSPSGALQVQVDLEVLSAPGGRGVVCRTERSGLYGRRLPRRQVRTFLRLAGGGAGVQGHAASQGVSCRC